MMTNWRRVLLRTCTIALQSVQKCTFWSYSISELYSAPMVVILLQVMQLFLLIWLSTWVAQGWIGLHKICYEVTWDHIIKLTIASYFRTHKINELYCKVTPTIIILKSFQWGKCNLTLYCSWLPNYLLHALWRYVRGRGWPPAQISANNYAHSYRARVSPARAFIYLNAWPRGRLQIIFLS